MPQSDSILWKNTIPKGSLLSCTLSSILLILYRKIQSDQAQHKHTCPLKPPLLCAMLQDLQKCCWAHTDCSRHLKEGKKWNSSVCTWTQIHHTYQRCSGSQLNIVKKKKILCGQAEFYTWLVTTGGGKWRKPSTLHLWLPVSVQIKRSLTHSPDMMTFSKQNLNSCGLQPPGKGWCRFSVVY